MSTLKVTNIQDTSGVQQYMCKAWVKFNASTGTPVINASGNVSSITDRAVGAFTVNMTNALADANYAVVIGGGGAAVGNAWSFYEDSGVARTSSAFPVSFNTAGSAFDPATVSVAVFR